MFQAKVTLKTKLVSRMTACEYLAIGSASFTNHWTAVFTDPRSPEETDRPFAEPAVFVINPQGEVQIVDISNAPFARPDLKSLLEGSKLVIGKGYPIRGRA